MKRQREENCEQSDKVRKEENDELLNHELLYGFASYFEDLGHRLKNEPQEKSILSLFGFSTFQPTPFNSLDCESSQELLQKESQIRTVKFWSAFFEELHVFPDARTQLSETLGCRTKRPDKTNLMESRIYFMDYIKKLKDGGNIARNLPNVSALEKEDMSNYALSFIPWELMKNLIAAWTVYAPKWEIETCSKLLTPDLVRASFERELYHFKREKIESFIGYQKEHLCKNLAPHIPKDEQFAYIANILNKIWEEDEYHKNDAFRAILRTIYDYEPYLKTKSFLEPVFCKHKDTMDYEQQVFYPTFRLNPYKRNKFFHMRPVPNTLNSEDDVFFQNTIFPGELATVPYLSHFIRNFNAFSNCILRGIPYKTEKVNSGCVVAGGSILKCLLPQPITLERLQMNADLKCKAIFKGYVGSGEDQPNIFFNTIHRFSEELEEINKDLEYYQSTPKPQITTNSDLDSNCDSDSEVKVEVEMEMEMEADQTPETPETSEKDKLSLDYDCASFVIETQFTTPFRDVVEKYALLKQKYTENGSILSQHLHLLEYLGKVENALPVALHNYFHSRLMDAKLRMGYDCCTSDIDIFIVSDTLESAQKTLKETVSTIVKNLEKCQQKPVLFKLANTLTIVTEYPFRNIQIIMHVYNDVDEILNYFDLDCCALAWDGNQVWATPRSIQAVTTRCNTVDAWDVGIEIFQNDSFIRLSKYTSLQFGTVFKPFILGGEPSFNLPAQTIASELCKKDYHGIKCLKKLKTIEEIILHNLLYHCSTHHPNNNNLCPCYCYDCTSGTETFVERDARVSGVLNSLFKKEKIEGKTYCEKLEKMKNFKGTLSNNIHKNNEVWFIHNNRDICNNILDNNTFLLSLLLRFDTCSKKADSGEIHRRLSTGEFEHEIRHYIKTFKESFTEKNSSKSIYRTYKGSTPISYTRRSSPGRNLLVAFLIELDSNVTKEEIVKSSVLVSKDNPKNYSAFHYSTTSKYAHCIYSDTPKEVKKSEASSSSCSPKLNLSETSKPSFEWDEINISHSIGATDNLEMFFEGPLCKLEWHYTLLLDIFKC